MSQLQIKEIAIVTGNISTLVSQTNKILATNSGWYVVHPINLVACAVTLERIVNLPAHNTPSTQTKR